MKKKIVFIAKYIFFLAVGACFFWLAIKNEDTSEIISTLKNADYKWLLFSTVFMLASHLFRALRWNQLISTLNYKTKTFTTFYAVMVGYFVNLAIPRLGEIARCGVLAKYKKMPADSLLGTVIAERAFDIISLSIILLVTFFSQINFLSDFLSEYIITPLISNFSNKTFAFIAISGIIVLIVLIIIIFYKVFLKKIKKYPFYFKITQIINGFLKGIKTIKYIKHKKLFMLYSVLIWLMYFMTIYFCFFAIDDTSSLSAIDALTVLAMGSVGILVPTPGGIGAYQYAVTITLVGLFKIDGISASTFANSVYFTQWFLIIIFGALSWGILFLSHKKTQKNERS